MKLQPTFHLLEKWILLVWKSPFVRVGKTICFIDYQKQSSETPCMFMLQLSAKHINIHSSQSSSSLNLSNSIALIHTGLMHLPHSSSTNSIHKEKPSKLQSYNKQPDQKSHYSNFVTSLLARHIHDSPTKTHPGGLLHVMMSEAQQRKLFWLKTCVAVECRRSCAGREVSPHSVSRCCAAQTLESQGNHDPAAGDKHKRQIQHLIKKKKKIPFNIGD